MGCVCAAGPQSCAGRDPATRPIPRGVLCASSEPAQPTGEGLHRLRRRGAVVRRAARRSPRRRRGGGRTRSRLRRDSSITCARLFIRRGPIPRRQQLSATLSHAEPPPIARARPPPGAATAARRAAEVAVPHAAARAAHHRALRGRPLTHFFGAGSLCCSHDSPVDQSNSLEVPNFNAVDFHVLELPPRGVCDAGGDAAGAAARGRAVGARQDVGARRRVSTRAQVHGYFSAGRGARLRARRRAIRAAAGPDRAASRRARAASRSTPRFRDGPSVFFGGLAAGRPAARESHDASASGGRLDVPRGTSRRACAATPT